MARRTDTCIYYHRNSSLLDDDLQEVLHSQTLVGTDRCSEWHHGSSTSLFEVLAEGWVCLAIWQYYETELYQFLGSLQSLDRVWKKIARVWVDFELEPVGSESLASHLCCEYSLLSVAHATGVRKELDIWVLHDMREQVVLLVFEFDTLHGNGYHFCFRSLDGFCHELVVVELSCSEEEAGVELSSCNY